MATQKFLALVSGLITEVIATVTGGTSGQAGNIPALDGTGRLDSSVMPVGIGADTYTGNAASALSAGAFVTIKSDGTVDNASAASTGADADGFVLTAVSSGASATVYLSGRNTALSSLTAGSRYYLSDSTPGGVTTTQVTGLNKRSQFLGRAISTTQLDFIKRDSITLAS